MFRGILLGLYVCAIALGPAMALAQEDAPRAATSADDKEARELFRIGKQAFEEGRFERALKYFRESYELSKRGALLSNIGTALDRLRRDQEALDVYRQYLESVPDAPNRRLIENRIRIIENAVAAAQPAPAPSDDDNDVDDIDIEEDSAATKATAPPEQPDDPAPRAPPGQAPSAATASHEVTVPTPQQTALAAEQFPSQPQTNAAPAEPRSRSITSRWWFWTGVGAIAAAAVVAGVAASAGGGTQTQAPVLLDTQTRVREL